MLTKLERAQAQWGGTSHEIDNWLQERKELLIRYCQLAELPPYEKSRVTQGLPSSEELQNFCQILVDYVSTGHFEIYNQIVQDSPDLPKATEYVADITACTDQALDFNDLYAEVENTDELPDFNKNLSKLGQSMEIRFEIEDKLLAQLHEKVTSTLQ